MKAGSMEGLIGASVNMNLSKTPMRVYKEAEREGNTAKMGRAMGYVTEFQEKANEYSDKAQEELAKELKEERKEQELKREQAIEKRKEETMALENNVQTKEPTAVVENTDVKVYTSEGRSMSTEATPSSIDVKIGE